MKNILRFSALILIGFSLQSLIVRHDIPDEEFIAMGKLYPQICHFPMGEGTLITSSWVLTAAHVATDLKRDLEKGMDLKMRCNDQQYDIENIVIHPQFKFEPGFMQNDIALVKIKGNINNISPVNLYEEKDEEGKKIVIVGAGDIGNGLTGPQQWDKITRAATNRIETTDDQWLTFNFDNPDSKKATKYEGVSGPGDSGGPALIKKKDKLYILGVSSHQLNQNKTGAGRYGAKEYYARVSSYVDWILEVINGK
jgi:secreted trypsin-like serine protease